jgi:hypothetical protein
MKFTTFIIVTFLLSLVSYTLSLSKRNNHKKLKHHKSLKSHKKFHSRGIIIGVNKVEREQIVEIVNDIRNQIATTASYNKVSLGAYASDMLQVNWDANLEMKAQEHANDCNINILPIEKRKNQDSLSAESIYYIVTKGGDYKPDWNFAINEWAKQINKGIKRKVNDFNWAGRHAADFTQLIWSKTDRIGCGFNGGCVVPQGKMSLYVCQYSPIGNKFHYPIYQATNVPPKVTDSCIRGLSRSSKYPGLCCEADVCIKMEEKEEKEENSEK